MTRVAVIGTGVMGRNHVRVLREMSGVELSGVADENLEVARQLAEANGTHGYGSHVELLRREKPDAVTVAVPTNSHHAVVTDALAAGCHVLVEKPIAGTLAEADGCVGVLQINWLTPTKIREIAVTGERGMFRADYLTQDLFFYENAAALAGEGWAQLAILRGVSEGATVQYAIQKREPLRSELETFVSAVRGEAAQVVSGADGREALRMALALIESADGGSVVMVERD